MTYRATTPSSRWPIHSPRPPSASASWAAQGYGGAAAAGTPSPSRTCSPSKRPCSSRRAAGVCDRPIALDVGPTAPLDHTTIVAHFLVPTSRMWDDVVHTCGNQRLFCGEGCVEAWCARDGVDEGYVMDLATLWRLASGWYAGRFERGYRRREPNQAREYFREVGLRGSFWGLE